MQLMNIQRGHSFVQAIFEYDKDLGCYRFENDIRLGDWSVATIVRIGGPTTSVYKYDYKNYLEFVITDKHGESRIKQYYHNLFSDEMLITKEYDDDLSQRGVRLFLENHPIFDAQDWRDYDASILISAIKKIVNSDKITINMEKVDKIRDILR